MSNPDFPHARLLLFAREPKLGRVKTRLEPVLGVDGCLELHRALLRRAAETLSSAQLAAWQLWVDGDVSHPEFLAQRESAAVHRQQGGDLGARMLNAANTALRDQEVEYVLIVGADCPAVDAGYLTEALQALNRGAEVVLGPAEDGGYVLIGLRKARPELFSGVRWGQSSVLAETVANCRASAIEPVLLDTRWDVDRASDLKRLTELQPNLPLSPELAARIADLGE